ncbi:TPA: pentapeptide MXKDX repeat protein [Salmonella enterica subsp. diarizonae serovar 50:k:z35]
MKKQFIAILTGTLLMVTGSAFAADNMAKDNMQQHDGMTKKDTMQHDGMTKKDTMQHDNMK